MIRFRLHSLTIELLKSISVDHGIEIELSWSYIEGRLNRPVYVGILFVGMTCASPYIRSWPQVLQHIVGQVGPALFNPLILVDRPILTQFNQMIRSIPPSMDWNGRLLVYQFSRFPCSLLYPTT